MPAPITNPHLWLRAETRPNEARAALTPEGAAALIEAGLTLTVERSPTRVFEDAAYEAAGATMAAPGTWAEAPSEAIILGLKELPKDTGPLTHRHIMFGHAYKGQADGPHLLARFTEGGGTLLDLEYLTDAQGRRVAAFGYWAGFVGAAMALRDWAAMQNGALCPPAEIMPSAGALIETVRGELGTTPPPRTIIIGAKGRVGSGAAAMCEAAGCDLTLWDITETAGKTAFPEVLEHEMFVNAILAMPGVPVFVPQTALTAPRGLRVIADVACDPDSPYNPIPVYHEATTWAAPCVRVATEPALDVMAIDNLPSLLPRESAEDFAAQLLPYLRDIGSDDMGVWARAEAEFQSHTA